jgi:regulator of replication initiation timing
MLTNEDIIKLSEVLATKEDIKDLGERVDKIEKTLESLLTSVDKLASNLQKYMEEQIIMKARVDKMEDWIKKAATKLGIDFSL